MPPPVRWLGALPDDELHALYAAAPITVSASEYEGFGLALSEAMAGGSAVIAVASSAVPEVVGDAGCLVARSDPALLAEALARLVAEPEQRAALSRGASTVLLLNNDARVTPGATAAATGLLGSDPCIAAVGAKVLSRTEPGRLWLAWGEVTWGPSLVALHGAGELDGPSYGSPRPVDWIAGCAMWLRAEALAAIGLLDEEFFAYHEEVDCCTRALAAGLVVGLYAAAFRHYGIFDLADEGTLLVQAARVAHGQAPYVDFHTGYGTLYFALQGLLVRLGGLDAIRALLVCVHAIGAALLYALTRRTAGRGLAVVAVALQVSFFLPLAPRQGAPFFVPYPAWYATLGSLAVVLLLRDPLGRGGWPRAACVGVLSGAAFAMKQNAGLLLAGGSAAVFVLAGRASVVSSAVLALLAIGA